MDKLRNLCQLRDPFRISKKAQFSFDVVMWFIKLLLLVSGAVLVAFVIYLLVVDDVGVEHLRAQIFAERILSSPDCLAYYDEGIDRYYPNIIDSDKLKGAIIYEEKPIERGLEELEKCIDHGDKKFIAAKLTLRNLDKLEEEGKNPFSFYYNRDEYKKWEPFTFDERYYLKINKQRYVLIRENDKLYRGRLQIEIVTPAG